MIENISNQCSLDKTINIGYKNKYLLSDIAMQIINDRSLIHIENMCPRYNYSGNSSKLYSYEIGFDDLEKRCNKKKKHQFVYNI